MYAHFWVYIIIYAYNAYTLYIIHIYATAVELSLIANSIKAG